MGAGQHICRVNSQRTSDAKQRIDGWYPHSALDVADHLARQTSLSRKASQRHFLSEPFLLKQASEVGADRCDRSFVSHRAT